MPPNNVQNGLPFDRNGNLMVAGTALTASSSAANRLTGAAPTRLITTGDSLSLAGAANGTSTIANMCMRKLSAYLGLGTTDGNGAGAPNGTTFVEAAVNAVPANRYLNALNNALSLTSSDLIAGIWMFNTMRFLGPDPASLQDMQPTLEGILAWHAIPESKKIRAINAGTTTPNASVVTAGTWAYFSMSAGTDLNQLGLRGTSAAGTATFPSVTGDTVYVWYARSTIGEAFSVSIDGTSYNVGGTVVYATHLGVFNSWEICLLRVNGLLNAIHTVVITRSPSNATVIAIAGFDSTVIRSSCPAVLIGNCPPMLSGLATLGYAFPATVANDPLSALLSGSATFDPPSLASGAGATTTLTVTGAALGDEVTSVSFSLDLQGITVTAWVSAANTVSVRFQNGTAGVLDLASGTLRARVRSASGTGAGVGGAGVPFSYGDSGVAAYNNILRRAISNLQDDGLRIDMIDMPAILNPAADVSVGDSVHFTDGGNEKMFRAYRRILSRAYS